MKMNYEEKRLLLDLLDVMTDRCPECSLTRFLDEKPQSLLYGMFKKLRLELRGF